MEAAARKKINWRWKRWWWHGSSAKWKRLQEKTINRRWQWWWWHGSSVNWKQLQKNNQLEVAAVVVAWQQPKMEVAAKQKMVNNQPEVAVVAMVTATVVVWWQTTMGHLCGSIKWKQLQKQSTRGGSGSCGMAAGLNGSGCKKKSTGGGSSSGDMVAALNGNSCNQKQFI